VSLVSNIGKAVGRDACGHEISHFEECKRMNSEKILIIGAGFIGTCLGGRCLTGCHAHRRTN